MINSIAIKRDKKFPIEINAFNEINNENENNLVDQSKFHFFFE